jgi:hypothetical protein
LISRASADHLMQRRRTGPKILIAMALWVSFLLLFFSLVGPSSSPVHGSQQYNRARFGFTRPLPDSHVVDMVERHDLDLRAVRMWTSGLAGSYRSYQEPSVASLVENARSRAQSNFQKGFQGNLIRLERFLETHTRHDVVSQDKLATKARSLVNIRMLLKDAGAAVRRHSTDTA